MAGQISAEKRRAKPGTRLWVLGGWRLTIGGAPASGPSYRKGRGLLAYLALEGGWHTREKLGELFGIRSAGYFRQLVSNLRSTLEEAGHPASLITEQNLLRLSPDYGLWLDAEVFLAAANQWPQDAAQASTLEHMERGASLYKGEFLHGLSLPDCPEFEAWMEVRRQHMLQQALALRDRLRLHAEAAGLPNQALIHTQRILELDAWNEAAHRHAMRLLAQSGRTEAALAHYETCRWTLERELGLPPEEETQRLHALIREGALDALSAPAAEPALRAIAERRLVTVLCCELVVPGEDDVDAIADALAQPRLRCQAMLASASGHRVLLHGNRLLAYFGLPLARENAARQAVRTALSVCDRVVSPVAARIGIHTGIVITRAQSDEPDAAGVASGQAIRLTEKARAGQVVVSEAAQHLARGYFHLQLQGSVSTPDADEAMAVFRVTGETGADNRLDSAASLSPLVGREAELNTLLDLWQDAAQGHRRSLLIRGDAGIGKSRLVRSLRERLAGECTATFELRCLPEFSGTPFHPLQALIASLAGFTDEDTVQQKLDKAADFILTHAPATVAMLARESLSVLADVLHLDSNDVASDVELSPSKRREKTLRLLLALLQGLGRSRPALLIVEDLHWCDPSTLDLLDSHVLSRVEAPLLTVLTSRPDQEWSHAGCTLELRPLSRAQAMELAYRLDAALPPEAAARIVAWSDGIPLYVEEMARMDAQTQTHPPRPQASLSLQELLAARLDSKGPAAKVTAQLAATLGRDFSLELLQWLSPFDQDSLRHALEALQQGELILAKGGGTFQFKHALIQDAAYQSLTRADRRANHKRIAHGLQQGVVALAENQPEVLARHLGLAGEATEAIELWLKAGRWAARRSANREAALHFESGLALLAQVPDARMRVRLELALQAGLGSVHMAAQGYGSTQARQAFSRAVALSHDVEDNAATFPVLFGLWQGGFSERVTAAPLELVERLERIALVSDDPSHRLVVDYAYGNNLFWLARHDQAARHQQQALAAPAAVHGEQLVAHYGEDCRNLSRCFLAWTCWFLGRPDEARHQMAQAITDARQLGHPHSLAFALTFAAQLQRHIGDAAETERLALELARLAEEHAMGLWSAVAAGTLGWAHAVCGQDAALDAIRASIEGAMVAMPLAVVTFRSFLTDALLRLDRPAEALTCIGETIVRAETYEDRYLLPDFLRQQAAATMALDPAREAEAQALLLRALELAQQQRALMLELRIASDLVVLSRTEGALAHLRRIHERFSEGFDTPDLKRAAGLLGTTRTSTTIATTDAGSHVASVAVAPC